MSEEVVFRVQTPETEAVPVNNLSLKYVIMIGKPCKQQVPNCFLGYNAYFNFLLFTWSRRLPVRPMLHCLKSKFRVVIDVDFGGAGRARAPNN